MRRGHAGIGGWRNENSRQFRPRTGGPPLFRHPLRSFGLLETPRFPPPNSRHIRPPSPFKNHPNQATNNPISEHHDRSKYRHDNRQSSQYRSSDRNLHHQSQRSLYPMFDRMRQGDNSDQSNQYNNYYDETLREPNNMNSMGDIDHRQQGHMTKTTDPYGRHAISPWSHSAEGQRQFYDDRSKYSKHYKHYDNIESNKFPVVDYTGHRPPASDHYGGNPGSSIDNSHSFSRSVDDTVDIVRKRLQNRNETQPLTEPVDHHDEDLRIPTAIPGDYQNAPQEPTPKKRVQRQRQDRNIESNCDKMKSKIVQQLFKMDKDRIHKLMDNPSSSSKFEYAISSLITESQNSLNKHMRSVAEKSLSSSEEFIHNDSNTIYEDTFMKQMQHILDPQDTVLLEDIKPLVLAELSKVLQLNEYDQPFQVMDNQQSYHQGNEQQNYDSHGETHNYEDYSHSRNSYYDRAISPPPVGYEDYGISTDPSQLEYDQPEPEKPKPLFERRQARKSKDLIPESREQPAFTTEEFTVNVEPSLSREEFISFASERRHSRRSIDSKKGEDKNKEPEPHFFDTNAEQLEEDDPFAELDNQYHVAVDHNFIDIDTYGISSPQQTSYNNSRSSSINRDSYNTIKTPSKEPINIKKEIDDQLQKMAKSPLKLMSATDNFGVETDHSSINTSNVSVKKEDFSPTKDNMNIQNNSIPYTESTNVNIHQEKLQNMNTSPKAMSSSSRKRSIDQKPSHRKEKRKKSEPTQLDSSKAILDKHTVTNINNYGVKNSEKSKEQAKPALSISKTDSAKGVSKDTKAMESADKSYSDKYVKRKETQKKSKDKEDEHKKRPRSLSTSHSMVSPKDCTNNNTQTNKTDSKTKLQSIDMFLEQPKKSNSKHQTHRNTAVSPNTPTKTIEITKNKQALLTFNRKITKKCVSTQVIHKTHVKEIQTVESKLFTNYNTRFCQTEKKRMLTKSVQTIPVSFEKSPSKATDVFERMKEIDLEIQVLLQEKFKLYSSIESNTACPSTIQTLGMTVLNMPLNEVTANDEDQTDNDLSEDAIVEEFTNIPVEELEQIALESVNEPETPQVQKKTRRHKISEESRANSVSPTVKRSARKAGKAPNISLLEQIITDDRPIEDIISLDDLEIIPVKKKKKSAKQPKKKANKKITSKVGKTLVSLAEYNLIECSVVLQREDLSKFLKPDHEIISIDSRTASPSSVQEVPDKPENIPLDKPKNISLDKPENIPLDKPEVQVFNDTNIVEETVVDNSISFDMLDVSEDIVVGDICEVKSGDNEAERTEVTVNEEIILDNSQSMVEPVQSETAPGENICKMYDYSTDENLRRDAVTVTGHADAVIAIECIENNFVAACLDGNVYYFSGDGQLISTLRGSNLAITCLTIVKEKYGTTIYTGSLDSRIRYYDLETGLEKGPECNVLSPIQTMDRAWDTIFVGTRTGFVLQFECKNNMLIPVSTVKFSDQSILALRAMKEGPRKVLLVAARSENVTIKDAQTGLLLRTLEGPKMTVYTLLYEEGKVYCGTSNHQIHVFDYASGSHAGVHEGGKGAVCLRSSGGLLFAGCYDGCVYIYREGEPRPLAQLRGPSLMLLSLAVVGSKIIAGYKDRSLYIWKIPLIILQEMIL